MLNAYKKSLSTTIFLSAVFTIFNTHCMEPYDLAAQAQMLLEKHYKASEDYPCDSALSWSDYLEWFPTSAFLPDNSMNTPDPETFDLATRIMYQPVDYQHFDSYVPTPTGKLVPFAVHTTANGSIFFRCKRCGYKSNLPTIVIKHEQTYHPNWKPTMEPCSTNGSLTWYCKLCQGTFNTLSEL